MRAQDIASADGFLGLAFDLVHEVIGEFDRLTACESLTDEDPKVDLAGALLFGEEPESSVDDVMGVGGVTGGDELGNSCLDLR
jgi:hypothetical protein